MGGEFLFVHRRGGLFLPLGRTIYITRFRFPIGSWNLSFRVHRFNNLEEQVSIFAKFPSPLVHRVLFSRGELHWINWK